MKKTFTKGVAFYVNKEMYDDIKALSNSQNKTLSEIVRVIVKANLENMKKVEIVMGKIHLLKGEDAQEQNQPEPADHEEAELLDDWDKLRLKPKIVELCNENIVEFAYVVKELIEYCYGHKLFFEQSNCYHSRFYAIREMLKLVDPEYLSLPQHASLAEFYKEGRELSNDCDVLTFWEKKDTDKGYSVLKTI